MGLGILQLDHLVSMHNPEIDNGSLTLFGYCVSLELEE